MIQKLLTYIVTPVKTAPLAVFRVFFGCLMIYSTLRFVLQGWVTKYYVDPAFHFKYFGFEFVQAFGYYTYILYAIILFSALGVALGYRYRLSTILLFLSFTYCQLIDKTYYLNHYYFISLVSFLLIFLPANAYFSVDAKQHPTIAFTKIPRYHLLIVKFMICIVYFYAGLAKINSEWLWRAMPLKIWLPSQYQLPILGNIFQQEWSHYFMSWAGMLYDLSIPFLLLYKPTRIFAFVMVVFFHIFTRVLFPIGVFPYVMIVSALIFFDASVHEKIIFYIRKLLKITYTQKENIHQYKNNAINKLSVTLLAIFFNTQLLFPFRYMLYPDELFWTEEGYRYSWRVMLMEKGGYVQFKVVNPKNNKWFYVDNSIYLTAYQQKQMAIQADFILQFAHFLEEQYQKEGIENPEIYVDSFIALNGRLSKRYIDPNIDLTIVKDSWQHKDWILPFKEKIYGF